MRPCYRNTIWQNTQGNDRGLYLLLRCWLVCYTPTWSWWWGSTPEPRICLGEIRQTSQKLPNVTVITWMQRKRVKWTHAKIKEGWCVFLFDCLFSGSASIYRRVVHHVNRNQVNESFALCCLFLDPTQKKVVFSKVSKSPYLSILCIWKYLNTHFYTIPRCGFFYSPL